MGRGQSRYRQQVMLQRCVPVNHQLITGYSYIIVPNNMTHGWTRVPPGPITGPPLGVPSSKIWCEGCTCTRWCTCAAVV
jgi:hypothetical protein